jgi:hypothetical protein
MKDAPALSHRANLRLEDRRATVEFLLDTKPDLPDVFRGALAR